MTEGLDSLRQLVHRGDLTLASAELIAFLRKESLPFENQAVKLSNKTYRLYRRVMRGVVEPDSFEAEKEDLMGGFERLLDEIELKTRFAHLERPRNVLRRDKDPHVRKLVEVDVVFLVPLTEEFAVFNRHFPLDDQNSIQVGGMPAFPVSLDDPNSVSALALRIGEGTSAANSASMKVLQEVETSLIVVLGIAGSLSDEIKLGDIVIGNEVSEFLHRSKAVDHDETYFLHLAGRSNYPTWDLYNRADLISVVQLESYERWQAACGDVRVGAELDLPTRDEEIIAAGRICHVYPKHHLGPIASGQIVGASDHFRIALTGTNRKFTVLETESSGLLTAIEFQRGARTPNTLILRGVSDFADSRKAIIQRKYGNRFRRYAMHNICSFMRMLLADYHFQRTALKIFELG